MALLRSQPWPACSEAVASPHCSCDQYFSAGTKAAHASPHSSPVSMATGSSAHNISPPPGDTLFLQGQRGDRGACRIHRSTPVRAGSLNEGTRSSPSAATISPGEQRPVGRCWSPPRAGCWLRSPRAQACVSLARPSSGCPYAVPPPHLQAAQGTHKPPRPPSPERPPEPGQGLCPQSPL